MNIEGLPAKIKEDVEDRSLEIAERLAGSIVIIGGWACRALLGERHKRYTLDVNGFCGPRDLENVAEVLKSMGFSVARMEWGCICTLPYSLPAELGAEIKINARTLDALRDVAIRIEISGPKMKEKRTHHFFEFEFNEVMEKRIVYHNRKGSVRIMVPKMEWMTANKLGLPTDYKNVFDGCLLLLESDVGKVAEVINSVDDWSEMVKSRMPRVLGRVSQAGLANTLLRDAKADLKELKRRFKELEQLID